MHETLRRNSRCGGGLRMVVRLKTPRELVEKAGVLGRRKMGGGLVASRPPGGFITRRVVAGVGDHFGNTDKE